MPTAPLTDRVRLERRFPTVDDGAGNELGEFREVATLRAEIRELRGDEAVLAGKLQGRGTCLIIVRTSTLTKLITAEDRLVDLAGDRILNVRYTQPPGRGGYITLLCESGVASG